LVKRLTGNAVQALDSFGDTDVMHDNGIWLMHNHRLARLAEERGIPRVVSTRGMLEPWALRHKRWKKRLAWWLYQQRDLKAAHCHHATAEAESNSVRQLCLGVPIRVIPNGVDVPQSRGDSRFRRTASEKTAIFLGRLYPVKGLPMLIDAWATVRPVGWRLRIVGPDEAGHRAQLEKAVAVAGLGEVISFAGPLSGSEKASAFAQADLYVLPTHSESFGVAIGEALAHGLPVLTTTRAPWSVLPERGCGWWVDPTVQGVVKGLRQATSLDAASLQAMGEKGRELVAEAFRWESVARQFVTMYEDLIQS
jgi:glycosyltransferase involved in cell wall biosynthesis